jgi:hypothetical protein
MGADALYMNRLLNVEFLDEHLQMYGNTNILQKNLFIILASKEIIAASWFFSVIHVSIVILFRWLSGNTHKLSEYNWGARSIGRALDMLHTTYRQLLNDIWSIHKETFMMHLFDDLSAELLPFKEFLKYKLHDQMTYFITASKNKSVQPYRTLIKELFSPTDRTNKSSTIFLESVAAIAIKAYLYELEDPKKATRKYISAFGSEFS